MLASSAARRSFALACLAVTALFGLTALAAPARAQVGSDRYSSIVIDAATGNVLSAANPDELRFPASLTKMMTLYLLFEAIRDHRISLNQYVPVSESAASMAPTKLGLVPGSLITVEQCILGLVTRSANDAAAALGELLGGDEDRFAQMMTLRAHALGMGRTTFRNASGLPDWGQVTTARDMAVLARHLVQDFPDFYRYFSTPYFIYGGHMVRGHNALTTSYHGADGIKTGYTEASGFNVVTSAVRGDTRLIGVVIGASNSGERNAHMTNLLDQGFDRMGVPPPAMLARREPGIRIPSLITVAHAAPAAGVSARPTLPRVVHGAPPGRRGPEPRAERGPPAAYAYRPVPAQIRPAATQVQAPRGSSTRTAHSTPYLRYPG
jgi:D-alanyl-D-alanine carboxypeptidase